MKDTLQFQLGELVCLRVLPDEPIGCVTGIMMRQNGYQYYVTWGDDRSTESAHYSFELEARKEVPV